MKQWMTWMRAAVATALMTALLGCATGPGFVGVEPPPEGLGQVYLYRPWQFLGSAATMKVIVDGIQTEATLPNSSWERLTLTPGWHGLGLKEYLNSFACAGVEVQVEVGKTSFVGVDFTTVTPIGTQAYLVCKMERREEQTATNEIAGMRRAK